MSSIALREVNTATLMTGLRQFPQIIVCNVNSKVYCSPSNKMNRIETKRSVRNMSESLKSTITWDITQCRPLKVNRRFRGSYSLFLDLKMEAICSSETSVGFQRTTRRYILEDCTLHNHCCENLTSYIF
jgi:hypothetical protein